jgi:hypothetical protein
MERLLILTVEVKLAYLGFISDGMPFLVPLLILLVVQPSISLT